MRWLCKEIHTIVGKEKNSMRKQNNLQGNGLKINF